MGDVDELERVRTPHRPGAAPAPRGRRGTGWNVVGLLVLVVLVFPVYWMISTAFKPDDEINGLTPTWFPLHPTLQHFRDAMNRPYFWTDVKNSVIIVGVTVAALDRARVPRGDRAREVPLQRPQALHRARDRDPDAAAGGADHPALRRARAVPPDEHADRRDPHVPDVRAAVRGLDAARLHHRRSRASSRRRRWSTARAGSARSSGSCCRSSRPGSSRRRSSRSSRSWNEYIFANVLLTDQSKQTVTVWLSYFYGHEPQHRLGRADGGLDADRDPGRRSSS